MGSNTEVMAEDELIKGSATGTAVALIEGHLSPNDDFLFCGCSETPCLIETLSVAL